MNKPPPAPIRPNPVQPEPWLITTEFVTRIKTIPGAMAMLDGAIYFPDLEGCWVLLPYGTMLSVVRTPTHTPASGELYVEHLGRTHEGYARDRALVEQALSWSTAFLT